MRSFARILKLIVTKIFGFFGVEVDFALKKKYKDFVFFDRNAVEALYNKDECISLYYDGLYRSRMEGTDNYFKQCRSYTLQQMLKHVLDLGLSGNVAECGCWKGHSSYIISKILEEYNFGGVYSIFDSFEGGLSDKQSEDQNARLSMSAKEIEHEKKIFSSAEEDLHRVLEPFDFYKLYKGWIPERFNEIEGQKFIFVHLDVDLYQPTLDGLEFFYPRLVKGGVIVIDDYGYTQFPGAKSSVDEFLSRNPSSLFVSALTGGCYIIK